MCLTDKRESLAYFVAKMRFGKTIADELFLDAKDKIANIQNSDITEFE